MTDASEQTSSGRGRRRTVVGKVVSDKMTKTITVREERKVKHPLYGKYIRRDTMYRAHDEKDVAREGDTVEIVQSRPLSKTKHWRLVRVLRGARLTAPAVEPSVEIEEVAGSRVAAPASTQAAPQPPAETAPAPQEEGDA